ncbi:MAG TPA: Mov34/MPN/PAD-1 family protein [Gemmatimonadales bacterium]|nr:Mov34/MPN/PAD-1 family protein [Gemmatimonadales bacterium]
MGPAIETGIGKDGRMQVRRTWILTTRSVMAVAGLMVLLALQPEPAGLTEVASNRAGSHARALILSDQARRYLALEYRSYPTEFMGCMIGEIHGNAVIVRRIAPADVEPGHSTATHVVPHQTCEDAGWAGTVGVIHSHPDGQRCWYYFPGTRVASSDAHSFARQAYPVDAIMCGNRVVWLSRDMEQQQVQLSDADGQPAAPPPHQRGNRVHAGAAAAEGQD